MTKEEILELLPYKKPFLFVDGIDEMSSEHIKGHYRFRESESFYEGHFKNNPVTPGVILTECMAQIGLVCLGIYIMKDELSELDLPQVALTSTQIDFFRPVLPNEKVTVISEKDVLRFHKLKCTVKMLNEAEELVARGKISGMLKA